MQEPISGGPQDDARTPNLPATLNEARRALMRQPYVVGLRDDIRESDDVGREYEHCARLLHLASLEAAASRLFVVDHNTLVEDWPSIRAGVDRSEEPKPPFEVTAVFMADPRATNLFVFAPTRSGGEGLFTALPVKREEGGGVLWRVPGYSAGAQFEKLRSDCAAMLLTAIKVRGLKPIGPPR
jgi:hypothetical protein